MSVADRFGANLRLRREASGLSPGKPALRADVHHTQVVPVGSRERPPRLETLVKFAGGPAVRAADALEGIVQRPMEVSYGGFDVAPPGARAHG